MGDWRIGRLVDLNLEIAVEMNNCIIQATKNRRNRRTSQSWNNRGHKEQEKEEKVSEFETAIIQRKKQHFTIWVM